MMYKNSMDPGYKARMRKEKELAAKKFTAKVTNTAEKMKDSALKKTEDKN